MWKNKKVSIVFPAYNEEENIRQAVDEMFEQEYVDEVIVVNNNSHDRTVEEASKTKAIIVNEVIQGYGAALQCGLRRSTGDFIILCEPDSTFVARDIIKLLSYSDDFQLVMGTRTTKELVWDEANMGLHMRLGNIAVAKMMEYLFNTPYLSDCGCTFRLITREALDKIINQFTVTKSHFLPEMVILCSQQKISMIEIPVNYKGRKGISKITGTLKGTVKTAMNMIILILRYRILGR